LADDADLAPERWVYRAIFPAHRDTKTGQLKVDAFIPRRGRTLSVFRADLQTPRGVLQTLIDAQTERSRSEDPAVRDGAREWLARFGSAVEDVVANGWSVSRVALDEFERPGLTAGPPDSRGHVDVAGEHEAFRAAAREIKNAAAPTDIDEDLRAGGA
jgi:hypothetical protein